MRKNRLSKDEDALEPLLRDIERIIQAEYGTFEKFCYGTEVISKSSLSRLLSDRKDCKVSTLKAISEGLGYKLELRLRKR